MKFKTSLFAISLLLLSGCGGGGGNPNGIEAASCSIPDQNQFVYDAMQDLYLYYDQLPTVDPSNYASPRALLEDLRVPQDRFSFIADLEERQNFFEAGTYEGIGFSFRNDGDAYTVTLVYEDSSAGRAGLKRSDRIVAIEGISITQINNNGSLNTFLSSYENGDDITFSVSSSGATSTDIEMSRGLVRINTVLKTDVITANSLNVGYLSFSSFIEPSKAELQTAFNTLKEENIDELVLDLRYNGGGRVDVAQRLASHIAGQQGLGADVTKLNYNDKNTNLNSVFPFLNLEQSIDIDRLYVLTLGGTCSASEIIINAMQPIGIDVITVGQTSCGKPVGSRNINFCDKTLSAITFDVVNDINQGEYFNGIAATCAANDDLSRDFADPNESMFATALSHIENGQCPVANRPSIRSKSSITNPADIMRSLH